MEYVTATTNLILAMSEEQQKAVHDFIVMLNDMKQEKGEKKATNPTTKPKKTKDVYEVNDTMRMLGKQNIYPYIDNVTVGGSIQDIMQARGYNLDSVFDVVFDVFLYGVITGKRQERAKKKATNPTTKQGKRLF